ncbi:hypothetical protein [Ilumatobacter coccineus]|uniref:Uncharacterized protein n=1 Tax=Ilumatobacter coccineus (strain NBRC 103263 / KCTC 29153 / YM16-304) TaxID=1313172 RepID=A0A6C7E7C1_ILUCY|nr:hypothetical protein [Ilumatobacter coccineus]BAN01119.1 hypothetical protein YM304_08050 [Ilumatobacter coccineus YM16-304]
MRRSGITALAAALVLAACGGGSDTATDGPSDTVSVAPPTTTADADSDGDTDGVTDTSPSTTEPSPTTSTTVAPAPEPIDFSKEPFVVFAPVPPRPDGAPASLPDGLDDFHALFDEDAPWSEALASLDGFKIHSWMIRHYLTDAELIRIAGFLERHDIALIIEAEPLDPPDPAECDHMESYEGPYEIENAARLRDLGITPAAYAIEQPFSYGHRLDTPGACRYELERVLDEVVAWAGELRAIFPEVAIGSIEALWDRPTTTPDDFAIWIDAYTAAMGEPPAFQHVDVNWAIPGWPETLRGIEEVVESRGVPFGPLYNGSGQATNDEWIAQTMQHISTYELMHGGTPGHVTIQSWNSQPDRGLPETETSAMTHLINRYAGARPTFEATVADGVVAGRVVDQAGEPIGGVPVLVETLAGPGTRQQLVLSGEVPVDVTQALLMLRVNVEDSFDVAADVTIHSISYIESESADGASGASLVPNGSFADGLDSWGVYDDNEGSVTAVGDDGDGAMRVSAALGARVLVDGPWFPVTPGADYDVIVDVTVADASSHGAIGLGFLDGDVETQRVVLDVRADDQVLGSTVSDGAGAFTVEFDPAMLGVGATVSIDTPGDLTRWPASHDVS